MFLGEDRRCRAAKNSRNFTNPTQIIGLEPSDIYHDTKFLLFVILFLRNTFVLFGFILTYCQVKIMY